MLYPIAIEQGDEDHAFGVVVPDIPGCFSAGDSFEEAFENAKQAIVFHIEGLLEDGEEIPRPTSLDKHWQHFDLKKFVLCMVDVDLSHLMGKAEKINITVPKHLLYRIDKFVATHPEYKNRSQFLTKMAIDKIFAG